MNPYAAFDLAGIGPALILALGTMCLLALDIWRTRGGRPESPRFSVGLAMVALFFAISAAGIAATAFSVAGERVFWAPHPLVQMDPLASFTSVILAASLAAVVLLSVQDTRRRRLHAGARLVLLFASAVGFSIVVSAVDLLGLILGSELAMLPLAALVAIDRSDGEANDRAWDWIISLGFASALTGFGAALLVFGTGTSQLAGIAQTLAGGPESGVVRVGAALLLAGFAYRLHAAPFHGWAVDQFTQASPPVAAWLAAAVPVAGIAVMLRWVGEGLVSAGPATQEVLAALSALTLAVGSGMALLQRELRRLFAWVCVAQAGFLLVGLAVGTESARIAVVSALPGLAATLLGAFGIVVVLARGPAPSSGFDQLASLAGRRPGLAALLTLFLFSLVGIPGTVGFLARFQLLVEAVRAGRIGLAAVATVAGLVTLLACMRLPIAMVPRDHNPQTARAPRVASSEAIVLGACALAVIGLGLVPNGIAALDFLPWALHDWSRHVIEALGGVLPAP